MRSTFALVTLVLCACGPHHGHSDLSGEAHDLSVEADLGGPDLAGGSSDQGGLPDQGLDETPPPGPYGGNLDVPSNMTIDGVGKADGGMPIVSAAHVSSSVGTLDYKGTTYPAVAYEHVPFGMYDLATIVATTPDGFVISYAYCMQGSLTYFYTESLDLAPTPNPATGTCAFNDTTLSIDAMFDIPTMLGYGPLADIGDVSGTEIDIHGGKGTVVLSGKTYEVDVFTSVDCSKCGSGGWQEMHATIRDASTLAFGIFYLQASYPGMVQLSHGFRFDVPMLWPPVTEFTAAWTLK